MRETGIWVVTDAILAEHTSVVIEGRCWGFELVASGPVMQQDAISVGIDTTASRFTWQSIGGLIFGAIGVGVFAFAFTKWMKGRKAVE